MIIYDISVHITLYLWVRKPVLTIVDDCLNILLPKPADNSLNLYSCRFCTTMKSVTSSSSEWETSKSITRPMRYGCWNESLSLEIAGTSVHHPCSRIASFRCPVPWQAVCFHDLNLKRVMYVVELYMLRFTVLSPQPNLRGEKYSKDRSRNRCQPIKLPCTDLMSKLHFWSMLMLNPWAVFWVNEKASSMCMSNRCGIWAHLWERSNCQACDQLPVDWTACGWTSRS